MWGMLQDGETGISGSQTDQLFRNSPRTGWSWLLCHRSSGRSRRDLVPQSRSWCPVRSVELCVVELCCIWTEHVAVCTCWCWGFCGRGCVWAVRLLKVTVRRSHGRRMGVTSSLLVSCVLAEFSVEALCTVWELCSSILSKSTGVTVTSAMRGWHFDIVSFARR